MEKEYRYKLNRSIVKAILYDGTAESREACLKFCPELIFCKELNCLLLKKYTWEKYIDKYLVLDKDNYLVFVSDVRDGEERANHWGITDIKYFNMLYEKR